MNKFALLTGAAALCFAAQAQAFTLDFNPYVSAKGALTWLQNKADVNYGFYFEKVHTENGDLPAKDLPGTIISDKTFKDTTWGFRLATGVATPVPHGQIRSELELGYLGKAKDTKGWTFNMNAPYPGQHYQIETSAYSGMINFYYDFNTCTRFTPYIGAGFGIAHVKAKSHVYGFSHRNYSVSDEMTDDNPAWNISLGAAYALNDHWSLDLGYRYTNYGRITESKNKRGHLWDSATYMQEHGLDVKGDMKIDSHEINLGVRYAF